MTTRIRRHQRRHSGASHFALIPFIDTGDKDAAVKGAAGCRELAARASRAVPPPPGASVKRVSAAATSTPR